LKIGGNTKMNEFDGLCTDDLIEHIIKNGPEDYNGLVSVCEKYYDFEQEKSSRLISYLFNTKVLTTTHQGLFDVNEREKNMKSTDDENIEIDPPDLSPKSVGSIYKDVVNRSSAKQENKQSELKTESTQETFLDDSIQFEREIYIKHLARLLGLKIKIIKE